MKQILVLVLLFSNSRLTKLYGQEGETTKRKVRFSIGASYLQTKIKNKNYQLDETIKVKNNATRNAEIQLLFPIKRTSYFITGLQYTNYSTDLVSQGLYRAPFSKFDKDGYYYYPLYKTDFEIKHTIYTLSVPLGIRKHLSSSNQNSTFFEAGVSVNYIFKNQYQKSGYYELKGLYPDSKYINLFYLLEDVPRLGFVKYQLAENKTDNYYPINLNYFLSCGGNLAKFNSMDIYYKAYLTSSIIDISKKVTNPKYEKITTEKLKYSKTTLVAYGISVGLMF